MGRAWNPSFPHSNPAFSCEKSQESARSPRYSGSGGEMPPSTPTVAPAAVSRGREVPMSNYVAQALVGEPEVLEDVATHPAWLRLKAAATALQGIQAQDGSIPDAAVHAAALTHVTVITAGIRELGP